jgi:hypothetical protein
MFVQMTRDDETSNDEKEYQRPRRRGKKYAVKAYREEVSNAERSGHVKISCPTM